MLSLIRGLLGRKKVIKRVDKTLDFSTFDLLDMSLKYGYHSVNWKKAGWIF